MKNKTAVHFAVAVSLMCVATYSVAASDQEFKELQSRVSEIEKKLDIIISKLGNHDTGSNAESNTGSSSALDKKTITYETGPILNVWLLNNNDLKMVPGTPSIGMMVDNSELFNFGSFRQDSQLKTYYKNKPTGLMWSGYLKIDKTAEYMIMHEFEVKPTSRGNGWSYVLYSKLMLGDKVVLENEPPSIRGGSGGLFPKTTSLKLPKGTYEFKLWLAGRWQKHPAWGGNYNLEPSNVNVHIKLRSPNAIKPIVINKEFLLHESS